MLFHWFEQQQVSSSLQFSSHYSNLSNNVVVWMVSIRPLISKSSSLFTNPLGTVPCAAITTGIILTFMFHSFFNSLARSRYFPLFFPLILLCNLPGHQSPRFGKFSVFCWLSLGLVVWLRLSNAFESRNPREFCASRSPGRITGWMVKFKFLAKFTVDHLLHLVVSALILF